MAHFVQREPMGPLQATVFFLIMAWYKYLFCNLDPAIVPHKVWNKIQTSNHGKRTAPPPHTYTHTSIKWPLPKALTSSQTLPPLPCPPTRPPPPWYPGCHLSLTHAQPRLLSPHDLALALSSTWNTPRIPGTGSCSPFRSRSKCHHFWKAFADHLTASILCPQLALSITWFCFASQNSLPCKMYYLCFVSLSVASTTL